MSPLATTCIDCGTLIPAGAKRCTQHQREWQSTQNSKPNRKYHGTRQHKTRIARVLRRDGRRCRYCGASSDLTLDYIVSLHNGGARTDENAQILCRSCNSRKGAR